MSKDISHPTDNLPDVQPGLYKHYKGGIYSVLFISRHSETLERMVCYKSELYGTHWSRPISEWHKDIDGQPGKPRFEKAKQTAFEAFTEGMDAALKKITPEQEAFAVTAQKLMAEQQEPSTKEDNPLVGNCPCCCREGWLHCYWKNENGYCHVCKVKWSVGYNNITPHWPETDKDWLDHAMFYISTKDYKEIPGEDMR